MGSYFKLGLVTMTGEVGCGCAHVGCSYILKSLEKDSAALSLKVSHGLAFVGSLPAGAGPSCVRGEGQVCTFKVTAHQMQSFTLKNELQ